jgi:hypothetical protein
LADFEEILRLINSEAVKETPVLPADRIRNAIITGMFEGGGKVSTLSRNRRSDKPDG